MWRERFQSIIVVLAFASAGYATTTGRSWGYLITAALIVTSTITAAAPCPNNTVAEPKDEEPKDDYQGRY